MSKLTSFSALLILAAALLGGTSPAIGTTLTFDELLFQSVDDLSVQGVTFDFKVGGADSFDAFYNSFGPGTITTIEDPSLTGDSTGILTLQFDVPTPLLQFGAGLNTGDPLSPGYSVELFGGSLQSLGVIPVERSASAGALGFSEALFDYSGPPVLRAVIDFADGPGSFAFDNLTYVPEPAAMMLAVMALVGLWVCRASS